MALSNGSGGRGWCVEQAFFWDRMDVSTRGHWQRWKKPAIRGVKFALGALIVWMVARSLFGAWDDLRAYGETLEPSLPWLIVSAGVYLLGLSCFGNFFTRIMARSETPVRLAPGQRAYLIGHLGKYVPGKALVVVLRVGLLVPYGARAATAAFATLYETLVMMATGGILAGWIFVIWPGPPIEVPMGGGRSVSVPLAALSMGIGIPLLILAEARVFPKLAMTASIPFPGVHRDALPRVSIALLAEGIGWSLLGWTLMGLSLVATIQGIEPGSLPMTGWPMAIAAVALATVAGFLVAIFPGGLVIREAVLTASLGPVLGAEPAIVAALMLRLVWVVAELAISGALMLLRPKRSVAEVVPPVPDSVAGSSPASRLPGS
ncbi:lysylphosphatidylglycerol synthase domain-containing protein [Tautonia rosea]|uniref:lysylphosphatidylglycerol synthase domain-containing protein n=1 Tax=Tautonia rosea TaxID=2728037 RepID=UPI001475FBB4|nr:lysylphosphatidylglycerol synthase domain-containing protein [Tautonia rosea]